VNDTKISGLSAWRKPLKRSLLLIAVPLASALAIAFGTCTGGTTTRAFVRAVLPIRSMRHHFRVRETWYIKRTNGQYEASVDVRQFSPDRPGLVMKAELYTSGCVDGGFWAPTWTRSGESWKVEFIETASDQSDFYAAMAQPDHEQWMLQQMMLDELIARVPNRPEGLLEVKRGPIERVYSKTSLLPSGYIHNTIVLVCAAAGLFELGRAVKGLVRSR